MLRATDLVRPGEYVAFLGDLGSGKTLNMTRLAAIQAAVHSLDCYANYDCFAQSIESLPHLFSIRDGILLLDELQSILDSRSFAKNIDITQWVLLVRKLGLRVFYTTQDFSQVDVRVRNVTGWLFLCESMTYKGQGATKLQLVRHQHGNFTLVNKRIMQHSPALYALYNTKDLRVKLTEEGRICPFNFEQQIQETTAPRSPQDSGAVALIGGPSLPKKSQLTKR